MLVLEEHRFKDFGIERLNQQRVSEERQAQQQRNAQPVKNYRVDTNPQPDGGNKPTFDNRPSPGIGSGPVGPLFVGLILWLKRKTNSK
jgi:Ca-activated chloride channel family protein